MCADKMIRAFFQGLGVRRDGEANTQYQKTDQAICSKFLLEHVKGLGGQFIKPVLSKQIWIPVESSEKRFRRSPLGVVHERRILDHNRGDGQSF